MMGLLIIAYTVTGGIKAITWADVQQMTLILCALVLSLGIAVHLLPRGVSFLDAVHLAGAVGKLNAVNLHFDPNDRYNVWSGLIGGMFLALAYFGCDQSQVQRYLTGKSIAQSRLSLIFNAVAKIPMQFFILFIGAIVFVFFVFERPPLLFNPVSLHHLQTTNTGAVAGLENRFNGAFDKRKSAAMDYLEAKRGNDRAREQASLEQYRTAQTDLREAHHEAEVLAGKNDTNYIFLSFVTRYLPMGIVGLVIAVIFSAAMSSTSGEINSLSTVTVIDIYRRHIRKDAPDHHYLIASRVATAFWGIYAVVFAQFGGGFGALIEVVNVVGSLFYGGLLGVFILAFLFKKVGASAAFYGVIAGEAVIFFLYFFTKLAFLWFNVVGPLVVVGVALAITAVRRPASVPAT